MTVICYLCKGKEVVQIVGDKMSNTLWPCPQCRLEEVHVRYEVTNLEMQQFRGEAAELDRHLKRHVKDRIIHELADLFDVSVEIDAKKSSRIYKVDAWIMLPKTKGG